jgi:two-component system, chemotaxis family, CheB/CheR fusion protein
MAGPRSFSHLVVIGSSAGGIEALSTVVATLPPGFPAPIVIGQHLDPSRQSHLGDILGRRSTLPVRTVNGMESERLEPSIVYVVPSNHDVYISDASIELRSDAAQAHGRPKPSIDLLLTSASETFGDRLIAVILSGTGSDGAAGARAVKKAGGTVIIQNPDTASYPGMPLSLAPTTVDIVANLDRIGQILNDLIAGIEVPTQPEERRELEAFLEVIRDRFDIDFSTYKTPTIMRRLQRRIIATDSGDLKGYVQYLNKHVEEYQQLVNSFLIKVTDFFRDPELFAFLRANVVPVLIEYAREHGNELRVWSAGCATGEEAYSLAILMAEALGNELERMTVRIFATDVDGDAIAFARRGVYPASALSSLQDDLIARYFSKEDNNYVIRKRVRAMTVFGQHDLGQRAPFPHIDLVMCRNVLIYFTAELQQRTLKLFAYSLRDGGYLVLGKAESTGPLAEYFALQHKVHKVYQREGDRILMPPARLREALPGPPHRLSPGRHSPNLLASISGEKDLQRLRNLNESSLLRLPVGLVVVDRRYDIQAINSAARRFLSIHGPAVGEDLVHLAQEVPPARLRGVIDAVFRTGVSAGIDELPVEELATGELRYLQIICHPQRSEDDQGSVDTAMLVVNDVTSLVQARQRVEHQMDDMSAELQHARRDIRDETLRREELIQRLMDANRQLLEANQELTSTNEGLRTTNEEFLLSAEEAQAATEEVETLNEELQATNEELETLNEELQATIEELNTTNDDLHSRSVELQDLAQNSEYERARLEAILSSMSDAVLVVDPTGRSLITNAAFVRLFGADGMRLVPGDEQGRLLPPEAGPRQRAARGESFSMEFTIRAADGTYRWYEANGQPVQSADGSWLGGLVVIRDISDRSLHRLQEEFIARASHELRTPLTPTRIVLNRLLKLLDTAPHDPQARKYAQTALEQITRTSHLIDDLLDVTRLQQGTYLPDFQPIRLDELVARSVEVAQMMTEAQMIELAIADMPLVVSGDAGRLEQVMLNVLNNAITHARASQRIDVRLRQVDEEAEIQVQDYGPGIPPEDLPHLFERFYQGGPGDRRPPRGLGLGLYIAHEIVTAHGGRITVASTKGQGTTFTIRLPLATADEHAPDGGDAPGGRSGTGKGRKRG